jgi:hypothetical protein
MATTVAQPGTGLKKIAKQYASEAGMPVDQYLERLRRLNPDFKKAGESTVRLGRGVGVQPRDVATLPDNMPEQEFDSNQVMNILDSPLYSQNLKDYYLSQYLPGLTQATFDINQAQTARVANEADRARQRGEAIRRVAGSYAARGMRSPGAINRDRSEIQSEFGKMSREEQAQIQALLNQRDVMFGAGAQDSETFLSNPALFGSIGAGARRSSLEGLQQLPDQYGLLGLNPSTAPLVQPPAQAAQVDTAFGKAPKAPKPKPRATVSAPRPSASTPKPKASTPKPKAQAPKPNVPANWLSGRVAF